MVGHERNRVAVHENLIQADSATVDTDRIQGEHVRIAERFQVCLEPGISAKEIGSEIEVKHERIFTIYSPRYIYRY